MAIPQRLPPGLPCFRHGQPSGHAPTSNRPSYKDRNINCNHGQTESRYCQVLPLVSVLTRLQCADGGMGQSRGMLFMQPDMLQPSRTGDEDFEIKVGTTLILLEFRVQQSPQTQMYPPTPLQRC